MVVEIKYIIYVDSSSLSLNHASFIISKLTIIHIIVETEYFISIDSTSQVFPANQGMLAIIHIIVDTEYIISVNSTGQVFPANQSMFIISKLQLKLK